MSRQKLITIDGPSGSGKGTIAQRLADELGWKVLDSGALYRLVGLDVRTRELDFEDEESVGAVAASLDVRFEKGKVFLHNQDVTNTIRSETAGNDASRVAALPRVREALLQWQRDHATPDGLIADGRDMGTVVFPDAPLKIFLTASPEERANRRYKQLKGKGMSANLPRLIEEIRERDERDSNRTTAPLRPAEDAILIDSSALSIDEVTGEILKAARGLFNDE
ncbi:MAG: (d)CMP kinase [Gammaproteobacteria bacterium]|jgi:cytidylate kinase